MATPDDLDRIAMALPEVSIGPYWGQPAYLVAGKAFVWQRPPRQDVGAVDPRTGVPFDDLVVIRFASTAAKEELLACSDPDVVFTIPHFRGFKAVLVHLDKLSVAHLEDLVEQAWRSQAPKGLREG
jgi:hypothetical protein